MNSQAIPSRLRESSFARYSHVLGALLRQFPRALVIDPKPLSQDTYRGNIRNAIRAKEVHNYCSSDIDEMLWLKYHDKIVCSMRDDGMIVLGDATTVKEPAGQKYGAEVKTVIDLVDNEYIDHVCELLAARALSPAPTFRVRGLDSTRAAELENKHDIGVMQDSEPNSFLII